MDSIDKSLVARRFADSLDSYSANAVVQRETAHALLAALQAGHGSRFDSIFEIGCGSGLLTAMIGAELQYRRLVVNDLAPACRSRVAGIANCEFIAGDIENIAGLPGPVDLIISNATFQWLTGPEKALVRLAGIMPAGGVLAFSTFGTENLREIVALTGRTLTYHSTDSLRQMLSVNFEVKVVAERSQVMVFNAPLAALEHLRLTGVTALNNKIWTKSVLKNFVDRYIERYSVADGVTLTYHPIVVIAVKR